MFFDEVNLILCFNNIQQLQSKMSKFYFALIFVVSVYALEPNIISTQIQVPNIDEKYQIVTTYLYPENISQSTPKISSHLQAQKEDNNYAKKQVKTDNNNPNPAQKSKYKSSRQQKSYNSEEESKQQQSMRDEDIDSQNQQIITIGKKSNEPQHKESDTAQYGKQILKQADQELNKSNEHKIPISSFSNHNQNLQSLANRQSSKQPLTNKKLPFYKQKKVIISFLIVVALLSIFLFQRYQQKKRLSWSAVISHLDTYHTTVRVIRQEEEQHLNLEENKLEQNLGKEKLSQQK